MLTLVSNILTRLGWNRRGTTGIQYGLIAALIAIAVIVALTFVGNDMEESFNAIGNHLNNAD